MTTASPQDIAHLEYAIALAVMARDRGDHPFGSVVVAPDGTLVDGLNSVVTQNDPTGHAETNVVRAAASALDPAALAASVLYTSTEPCAMCAGAIHWSGISRIVYAFGEDELREVVNAREGIPTLALPCREVFSRANRPIEVVGPVPLHSARAVHEGFWV